MLSNTVKFYILLVFNFKSIYTNNLQLNHQLEILNKYFSSYTILLLINSNYSYDDSFNNLLKEINVTVQISNQHFVVDLFQLKKYRINYSIIKAVNVLIVLSNIEDLHSVCSLFCLLIRSISLFCIRIL